MNAIWGSMILVGVIYGILTGHVEAVSDAVLSSAKEAVTLCITMLGVMGLWMGLMEIAQDAGLVRAMSKKIQPLIRFLFPRIPAGHPAAEHITMNCVANFLGLGWAATPAGLRAMESLAELEEERRKTDAKISAGQQSETGKPKGMQEGTGTQSSKRRGQGSARRPFVPVGTASNEMCTFLILNISSLQLIPVNVIAYRSQYGSVNPAAIVGPGIVATAVSTIVAVIYCKMMDRKRRA